MGKDAEFKDVQHQVAKLHTWQQRRTVRVAELQAEAEQITTIIHPVHIQVQQVVTTFEVERVGHISVEDVEKVVKVKEDVQWQTGDVMKIFNDFQVKLNTMKISIWGG